jgi:MFS family permease
MTAVSAVDTAMPDIALAQRRVLTVLFASQVLSGAGLAAGITVGALLAEDMLGSTRLAGLPSALFTAGSALAALGVGRISQNRGRRAGLATGYFAGAVGSAGVITAAVLNNPALLFVALFVYGAGSATNLQARYAGADLATPDRRARALSTVLVATTLGGVVGPNLAAPTGGLAEAMGIPHLAGAFLLAGVAYALAALVLAIWLRPDPLLVARAQPLAGGPGPETPADIPHSLSATARRNPGLLLGALTMILTQLIMIAVMTMTPVHMRDHGHGTAASGLVIAVHVGAMYLPSPLTGWLVDRFGHSTIAAASVIAMLAAGTVGASASSGSVGLLALALALLGVGWNFGLIAGTAMITDTAPLATRAKTQGLVDVSIAIAGATGGLASGLVVATASYSALALIGGLLSLAILPAIVVTARSR